VVPERRRIFRHPGRVAVVVLVLLAVVNLGVLLVHETDTSRGSTVHLPTAVESVSPDDGAIANLNDTITADLQNNLTGVLVIGGPSGGSFEVPEDQLNRIADLGEVSFRPGPGKDLTKFEPGGYTITVFYWDRTKPRPAHPASFSWHFVASA
jgi:hypothetical protein